MAGEHDMFGFLPKSGNEFEEMGITIYGRGNLNFEMVLKYHPDGKTLSAYMEGVYIF